MKGIDQPLARRIRGVDQFIIPVFQRAYSWKAEEHCAQLWDDVLNVASGDATDRHFLGTIVAIPTEDPDDDFDRWLVVDGQQRLTTVMLLLTAIRDRLGRTKPTDPHAPTVVEIDEKYLKNPRSAAYADDKRYKLRLRGDDHEAFSRLIDERERREGASPAIYAAYDHFVRKLNKDNLNAVWRGVRRLVIVDVQLDRGVDDPQRIFESLNSTGLDLRVSDLVRNFILMGLDERAQTEMYHRYWSEIENLFREKEGVFDDFIRDYLDMQTGSKTQTRRDRTYPDFRKYWNTVVPKGHIESALGDMVRHANHYAAFRLGAGKKEHPAREERYHCIRRNSEAPAITIMQLLECRESGTALGERELLESLSLIESFLVRRAVCRSDSRSYGTLFATLAARIGSVTRGTSVLASAFDTESNPLPAALGSPLEALGVALHLGPWGHDFPSDDAFGQSLRVDNLYHKRVCKFLLDRIQNDSNKEPVNTENLQIEHILPQNPTLRPEWRNMLGDNWQKDRDTWLHRLGNLTLTGRNPHLRDFPFQDKKDRGFLESSLGKLNRLVIDRKVWDADAIKRRTNDLAKQALGIWHALRVEESSLPWLALRQRIDDTTGRTASDVPFRGSRKVFQRLRDQMLARLSGFVEIPERKSVSYHRPRYFLEVVPRKGHVELLMALPYEPENDPTGRARDLSAWERVPLSQYKQQSGTIFSLFGEKDIDAAMHLIEQAYRRAE